MYFRYMSIAFVTNGLGVFGLRILAAAGLANTDSVQYLTIWYFAGAALASVACLRSGKLLSREWLIGGAMAVCSLCGQLGMANALAGGLPGYVVFPVATGGGLLLVVATGVGLFRERMGAAGYLGISIGIVALILLALPG
jgi:multidrug transporter EmrE-like cation transporter